MGFGPVPSLQSELPARRRTDPGRLGEGRRDGDNQDLEWTKYREQGKKKDRPGAFQIGWTGDNGDPDNFFATLFSCSAIGVSNYSSWCDKEFEDLIQKAKMTSDQAERTKLYEQAQVVFKSEAPAFPLGHSQVYAVCNKKVTGLDDGPARHPPLRRRRQDRIDWYSGGAK